MILSHSTTYKHDLIRFYQRYFARLSYLIQLIRLRFIFGRQIQEQLLHIPVEQSTQICLQIEGDEAEIVEFLAGSVVGHVLHQRLDCVDFYICTIIKKNRGDEAAEC